MGYTLQIPEEDRFLISKQELMNRICILLGGRVAENIQYQDVTTGAQNDLERATHTARQMVTEYGMSDRLGPVRLGRKQHEVFLGRDFMEDRNYSEEIAFAIDQEVRSILDGCFDRVTVMLTENKEILDTITHELLEKEVLETEDLDRILGVEPKTPDEKPKGFDLEPVITDAEAEVPSDEGKEVEGELVTE